MQSGGHSLSSVCVTVSTLLGLMYCGSIELSVKVNTVAMVDSLQLTSPKSCNKGATSNFLLDTFHSGIGTNSPDLSDLNHTGTKCGQSSSDLGAL